MKLFYRLVNKQREKLMHCVNELSFVTVEHLLYGGDALLQKVTVIINSVVSLAVISPSLVESEKSQSSWPW